MAISNIAMPVLKRYKSSSALSVSDDHLVIQFDHAVISFKCHPVDTAELTNVLNRTIESPDGYPDELSDTGAIKRECAMLLAQGIKTISTYGIDFDIAKLLKVLPFVENINYDLASKRLFFFKDNIRGVIMGMVRK